MSQRTDEAIEAHIGLHDTVRSLRQQRDELLEACEAVLGFYETEDENRELMEQLNAAIAKAKEAP